MRKIIKASSSLIKVKAIVCHGMDTQEPTLQTIVVSGSDYKEVLIELADHQLVLPYLHLDFNEPDTFTAEELADAIVYYNGTEVDMDYIFLLEVNGQALLDNTENKVNYRI